MQNDANQGQTLPNVAASPKSVYELATEELDWDIVKAQLIIDLFNGDELAYQEDLDESLLSAISWQHIADSASILPELEKAGHALIKQYLGYLPHEATRVRHEPFIRALLQSHRNGALATEAFDAQLKETVKLIRNADMKVHTCLDYKPGVYARYDRYLPEYRDAVRARLAGFLSYSPELRHSLVAELWLREVFAQDAYQLPDEETDIDRRAMTVIKYREALTSSGKQAADASPLLSQ